MEIFLMLCTALGSVGTMAFLIVFITKKMKLNNEKTEDLRKWHKDNTDHI